MSDEAERAYAQGVRDVRDWLRFHKPGPYAIAEDLHTAKQAQANAGKHKDTYAYCYWDGYIATLENATTEANIEAK